MKEFAPKTKGPVSKKEMDALIAQRPKPKSNLNMDPPGMAQVPPNPIREQQREKRIAEIKERLEANRSKARDGFNRSRGR